MSKIKEKLIELKESVLSKITGGFSRSNSNLQVGDWVMFVRGKHSPQGASAYFRIREIENSDLRPIYHIDMYLYISKTNPSIRDYGTYDSEDVIKGPSPKYYIG